MGSDLWRWADPSGQQRDVRLDELRAALAGGVIPPNTLVWRSGWQNWQPAHQVPELSSASFGAANGVVLNIPPPPLAVVAVQQEYEALSSSIVPAAPPQRSNEPPPPPAYVPAPVASQPLLHPSSDQLKTQLGGSAYVPTATGSTPSLSAHSRPPPPVGTGSAPGPGVSLPTTIGVPPPPEVLAMAAAARRPASLPPPVPPKPTGPVEELSGSALLDRSSSPDAGMNGGPMGGYPPPTHPLFYGEAQRPSSDDAGLYSPPRTGLDRILDDLAEIRAGRPPKNTAVIAVLGVVALSFVVMLVVGVVSLLSGSSSHKRAKTAASASASAKSAPKTAAAAATTAVTAASETKGPALGDCVTDGSAKTIAPRAQIASGIEAHVLSDGIALGFAASARDGVATSLDASTLSPTSTVRAKPTGGDARRVTPISINGKLTAMPDVDRKGDRITSRRIVPSTTLIDVGQAEGAIVWAPHGRDSYAKLFALDGDAPVEALRAIALTDRKGIALTWRRGNAINIGVAKGDAVLEVDGELSQISGLGQVGSPTIASSGDRVIVAWADRAGANDDWSLRWTKIKPGASTQEATPFTIPEGGLGGQAMSPSVASLGGGRFLLAWTEGPVSNHQVRAITIGSDGLPSGPPLAISAAGLNAGQPAAVVGPDGRGAIAFLSAKGKSLEVQVTPIRCPPR
jgi:hypothetical protein